MGGRGEEGEAGEDNREAELMHQPYWIISKAPHIIRRWPPIFSPPLIALCLGSKAAARLDFFRSCCSLLNFLFLLHPRCASVSDPDQPLLNQKRLHKQNLEKEEEEEAAEMVMMFYSVWPRSPLRTSTFC